VSLPQSLEIKPLERPPRATIVVPGSKSITNRALVLGALGSYTTECRLAGALKSEDTEVMVESLRRLGFKIETAWDSSPPEIIVRSLRLDKLERPSAREGIWLPASEADLDVANSGTSMRFLTALAALGRGRYCLDGAPRMRERPIEDLLGALRQLGVTAYSERGNGCPPVVIEADGLAGGRVWIKGDVSSQFLSGLLMAAPLARRQVTVSVDGALVSRPYVAMTLAMMRRFGARVHDEEGHHFAVPGRQHYSLSVYEIEPDASAASYFWAAAAVAAGEVRVANLTRASIQGDIAFLDVLEAMGCTIIEDRAGLGVRGGPLKGVDVRMTDLSDCVMTLAAVACFADGPTTIRDIGHIRHKETDRIRALATELRRLGAGVHETADTLTVRPDPLHGAAVDTYQDHRIAMSLALIGLRVPGVVIRNPGCVAKTYPNFFADLARLYDGEAAGEGQS
jgi:3-phosphoshikimate 1-carboxyvinyltransferase